MACALPVLVQTESDGIPDFLLCPICLELPEKVFQCKEGHTLCGSCYVKYVDCPICRSRFDKAEPIRNRYFEGLLDKVVKVDCAYKINGCIEKPTRELVHVHQTKCLFNIDRFGKLVNLCPLIDYKGCDFRFNTGNIEDAVQHFVLAHSCILTESGPFQMKLTGFQKSTEANPSNNCFWTPVISDLKERKSFLFTCAMLNGSGSARSLTCFSLLMPKSHEVSESLTMEYSVGSDSDKDCHLEVGFYQNSMLLGNVESLLPNNLPCSIQIQSLKSHLTEDGSLLVNCNVRESGTSKNISTDVKVRKLERIVCSKTVSNVISPACSQGHDSSCCDNVDSKIEEEIINIATTLTAQNIENGINVDDTELKMSNATPGDLLHLHDKILVENLPDFATEDNVKNVFTKFGEIKSIQMLKQKPNGNYLFCSSKNKTLADACIVDFACQASVKNVLTSRRPFIKKNKEKHFLTVKRLRFYTSAPNNEDAWKYFNQTMADLMNKAVHSRQDRNEITMLIQETYLKLSQHCNDLEVLSGILLLAAEYGTVESVKYCIEKGMVRNEIGMRGEINSHVNLLATTLFDKDKEIGLDKIKLILESGMDMHFKDEFGRSLIHMSVLLGSNDKAVKFFLEKGLNVNGVDKAGETPLHSALRNGPKVKLLIEKVKLLLDHGASLNIKDLEGRSPLNMIREVPVEYRDKIKEMFGNHLKGVLNLN